MKKYVVILQYIDESLELEAYLIETEEVDLTRFCDSKTLGFIRFSTKEQAEQFRRKVNAKK